MHETRETVETVPVPATGRRYDDELWLLIYEIWAFEADRNAHRARQKLVDYFRETAEDDLGDMDDDSMNIPTVRSIQYRAKHEDWAGKATDDIARIAPRMYKAFNARLFAQIDAAQRFDGDVLAGKYGNPNSPGVLAVMEKVAARLQTLSGIGTAAGLMPSALPQPTVAAVDEGASVQELGARMREKLQEGRR